MRKWFKGISHPDDAVDFQTSTTLWEVKSCNFYNPCHNGNHLRPHKNKIHQKIWSYQCGRFKIEISNHEKIKELGDKCKKQVKYILVAGISTQIVWRCLTWQEVDEMLPEGSVGLQCLKIKEVFGK